MVQQAGQHILAVRHRSDGTGGHGGGSQPLQQQLQRTRQLLAACALQCGWCAVSSGG